MATIKIKERPIGGGEEELTERISRSRGPIENSFEIRDLISGLVGKGDGSYANEDSQKFLARLQTILGRQKANELATKISIYNQDPRYKGRPLEERISSFYEQQKGDPVVGTARSLGYGVLPSLRTSPNVFLQSLQGNGVGPEVVMTPDISKKIALKISK